MDCKADLIVVDGGKAQMNTAIKVLKSRGVSIDIAAVTKNEKHKPRQISSKRNIRNEKYL